MTDKQVQEITDAIKVQTLVMSVWLGAIIGLLFNIIFN
jgi:hypothetical protein